MKDPSGQAVIRRATAADAEALSALVRAAFAEFEPLYTQAAFAATVLAPAGVLARLDESPIWVAESPSAVLLGTVGTIQSGDLATIRGMAVHPLARGAGLGKRLLDEAELFAAEHHARIVELYTTAFLYGAIRLYEAAGFEFTGETVNPNGTELLRMAKALRP
jgi:ribosomal protein S18 acetylase RimI-like enzyme